MSCFMCKGSQNNKMTTFMVDLRNCIVIVKNVPSKVCSQCGEISYSDEISKQLESIANSMRTAITEIAVVNFTNMVAYTEGKSNVPTRSSQPTLPNGTGWHV